MTGASLLVSMRQSNRMAARKAGCAPKALGDALAMDAHVNEPNSRRRGPEWIWRAAQMQAVPVSAKNMASSSASSSRKAATYPGLIGLIPGLPRVRPRYQVALPARSRASTTDRAAPPSGSARPLPRPCGRVSYLNGGAVPPLSGA